MYDISRLSVNGHFTGKNYFSLARQRNIVHFPQRLGKPDCSNLPMKRSLFNFFPRFIQWTYLIANKLARVVESSLNVMSHGDAREEKWRGKKGMEWVTSKRHMTAEHRLARAVHTVQADVHSSLASSRLKWRPRRFKWTRPFLRKTKSGFCVCALTFRRQSNTSVSFGKCAVWIQQIQQISLMNCTRISLVLQDQCQDNIWIWLAVNITDSVVDIQQV